MVGVTQGKKESGGKGFNRGRREGDEVRVV